MVALELKHRAPKAHTMLEIVYVRWGPVAHITFFFFAILTNLLVSLSMLQGGVSGCILSTKLPQQGSYLWFPACRLRERGECPHWRERLR